MRKITQFVADYFGIPVELVKSKSRKREVVESRQLIVYFISLKNISWERIGKPFKFDHSSAYYARNTIENMISIYPSYYLKVQQIGQQLQLISKSK